MAERMLIVVDVQNDFCEGGALAVDGGAAVAARIAAHLRANAAEYDRIAITQDWHDPDSDNRGHVALPPATPDFTDTWPVHCVAGTPGAQLHPALAAALDELALDTIRVRKGQGRPDYSGLQGTSADGAFADLIHDGEFERIDVVGLAFDHCVRATALDAAAAGASVRVIRDLSAAVSPERTGEVEQELRDAGIALA